jgi:hypothetical protein
VVFVGAWVISSSDHKSRSCGFMAKFLISPQFIIKRRLDDGVGIYLPLLKINVVLSTSVRCLLPSVWSYIYHNSSLRLSIPVPIKALIENCRTKMSSSYSVIGWCVQC